MKCVVLFLQVSDYVNRAGQSIHLETIYYFTEDREDSRLEKGFRLLSKNVAPDFSISDFPELPGIYDLSFRPMRGRGGKMEPKLFSINFLDKFSIAENDEFYLILGGKKYNFEDKDGKLIKGLKFFAIDPLGYINSSDGFGYPILEASIKGDFNKFQGFPAYYDIDLEMIRGRNGDALYRAGDVRFVAPFVGSSVSKPVVS